MDAITWPDHSVITIDHISDLLDRLSSPMSAKRGYRFVWRGVSSITYRFDPGVVRKIARELYSGDASQVTETDVEAAEASLLSEARTLGLDQRAGLPELTDDELRALLQHHGAATRLLDVSTNAFVALWMAVSNERQHDTAGALFAIDWPKPDQKSPDTVEEMLKKPGTTWLWQTRTNLDPRIQSQSGKFLLGRVPDRPADRTRSSLPLVFDNHFAERIFSGKGAGKFPTSPTIIFKLMPSAKVEAARFLKDVVGMTPSSVYPDLAGFAQANRA